MTERNQTSKGFVLCGAMGFLLGVLISTVEIWPEVFQRLRFSLSGGGGESAEWGEPLFYVAIVGVPWEGVGALISILVKYAISLIWTSKN